MTKVKSNFTGVDIFCLPPEGEYNCLIENVIAITDEILDEQVLKFKLVLKAMDENIHKAAIVVYVHNSEKSQFKVKELLLATGCPPEKLMGEFEWDSDNIIGKIIRCKIIHKVGMDGVTRTEVVRYMTVDDKKDQVKIPKATPASTPATTPKVEETKKETTSSYSW